MKYNMDTSRMGMLIALGVVLAALWLVAAYGFYKESERVKYDVRVSPGAVTYGTHSTALMPVTISPIKHALPMISGAAVRSYAYGGHATMSSGSSAGSVHTTSSAKVKNIGAGGGGNYQLPTTNHQSNSSRGIQYSGGSVAMPSIAMVSTSSATRAASLSRNAMGVRKTKWSTPDPGSGKEGDWYDGGVDGWYYYDEGGWRPVEYGDKRIDGGAFYWNGSTWVPEAEWDPETTPVGPMPWIFMLLLAAGYMGVRTKKRA